MIINNAQVAELEYAYGSEPYPARVEGPNPSLGTNNNNEQKITNK